jgi:chemotaxis protein CheX
LDAAVLGELVRVATCDVFSTMLALDLEAAAPFANSRPLSQGDVTAMIGIAGDQRGFVAILCTSLQAREFTARLLGMERDEVTDSNAILDAVGELVNIVAGSLKTGYVSRGNLQISLPTVVTTPKSEIRVAGVSVIVDFSGAAGTFRVEVMLADPRR